MNNVSRGYTGSRNRSSEFSKIAVSRSTASCGLAAKNGFNSFVSKTESDLGMVHLPFPVFDTDRSAGNLPILVKY